MRDIKFTNVAGSTPFDNSENGFTSEDVQGAIEEAGNSVSPGYQWTRSGGASSGTWLQFGAIPSNRTGSPVGKQAQTMSSIEIGNEDVETFEVTLYWHEGNSINLTSLVTVSVVSSRTAEFDEVDFGTITIPAGKQLAARITSGSSRNVGVTMKAKGF